MSFSNQIPVKSLDSKNCCWLSIAMTCILSACASNQAAPVREALVVPVWNHEPTWSDNKAHSPNYSPNYKKNNDPATTELKPHTPTVQLPTKTYTIPSNFNGFICDDAPVHIGKSLGNGECVDLVKLCSKAPLTRYWKPGEKVFGNDIPPGTAIATFRRGKYPNKSGYHAAIYSHQDKNGIYAWDQWHGQPVHLRYIKARQSHKDAGNNASKYRVIRG